MDLFPNLFSTSIYINHKSNNVYNIVTRTPEVTFWTLMRSTVIGVDSLCCYYLVLNPKCCHKS